jgi:excinuclease ABC subunit B
MVKFELVSDYTPKGDQPAAIAHLVEGIQAGKRFQTLLGATGTGKTYSMANVITQVSMPTLVMAPNKLLAAQLYQEFKEFFPNNAVHYYISYFDYYQPEAYNPATGTYIEKDSDVNAEIMKYRLASTHALMTRQDVIVVASVSCIYGIGNPIEWSGKSFVIEPGMKIDRHNLMLKLIGIQYERNDFEFKRGQIRVRGDTVDVHPGYLDNYYRISFFGDEIESIYEMNPISNEKITGVSNLKLFPTREYVTVESLVEKITEQIHEELNEQVAWFKSQQKWAEAQRLEERVNYDLEMLRETGYTKGIENYSLFLDQRQKGDPPACLYDYFPKKFLLIMDESHIGVPQIRGMIHGDQNRKKNLVDYGFRLPSALDNRPLRFEEWEQKLHTVVFTSATPGEYELHVSGNVWADQVIRPTGLVDPTVEVKPVEHQIDDLLGEIRKEIAKGNRILVTTLTKRMAENITDYYSELGLKIRYLHSDIDTVERLEIIRELRQGKCDVLIGINLLREGLDLPEVGLVAILDGDKEGFLRDTRSLIQTIGRASRNSDGRAIIYADKITRSITAAINETNRRREKQVTYNQEHGITPESIKKKVQESLVEYDEPEPGTTFETILSETIEKNANEDEMLSALEQAMLEAARNLDFEKAASIRDAIQDLKNGKKSIDQIKSTPLETRQIVHIPEEDNFEGPQDYSQIQLLGTPRRVREGGQKRTNKKTSRRWSAKR